MKFIGFYTKDTPYKKEADELTATLNKYDLDFHIYEVESKKSWVKNCAQKSTVIKQALTDFSDDIFYLDVDARILRKPPLEVLVSSVPMLANWVTPFGGGRFEILSGSIFFPNNELSMKLIEDWEHLQQNKLTVWDQKVLQLVVEKHKYKYESLPLEWCWIKEFMKDIKDPIIWHTQASRRLRRVIK